MRKFTATIERTEESGTMFNPVKKTETRNVDIYAKSIDEAKHLAPSIVQKIDRGNWTIKELK